MPPVTKYAPLMRLLSNQDVAAIAAETFSPYLSPHDQDADEFPRVLLPANDDSGRTDCCCFFGVPMRIDPERVEKWREMSEEDDEDPYLGGTPDRDYVYSWLEDHCDAPLLGLPEYTAEAAELDRLKEEFITDFDDFYRNHPGEDVNAWVRQLLALRQG